MLSLSSSEVEVEENYNTIMKRVLGFTEADRVQELGLYPYFRPISSEQDTEVVVNGKKVLMFGSNSYLGLTTHPKVKEAAKWAIEKYGTGCAGSRFLNGTLDIHIECEEKIAQFIGKEAALLYSTGFQVNQGVISALVGRDEYVLLVKLDHASIVEGARLSFGQVFRFKHNDMNSLERVLQKCELNKGKLIVVDGVFSMDGDIADLPTIVQLAEKYHAMIMVDDAHAIGVIGEQGRGTTSHFDLTDSIELIMGTFSKSLASMGGFIASDRATINYLKHHSRALIFSASMPASNVASVMAALDIIEAEPERIQKLCDNTRRMADGLKSLGFDLGKSTTPILPLFLGDDLLCFKMCRVLNDEGIFVNPVVSPAVEAGHALLRVSLMATHTFEQIDCALEKFQKVGKHLGIIT
jgi:8-amino-7-oxononanoate synthase